jgi:hypothetical protein
MVKIKFPKKAQLVPSLKHTHTHNVAKACRKNEGKVNVDEKKRKEKNEFN